MPIRISGLNSGLDTDAIVKELVSAYSTKKDKYVKAQTKLSWKQDAWKTLNSKIYSLYNTVGNLKFSSAYSMKTTTVSDTTKAKVTAGDTAVNGSYTLQISDIAKSGYLTGGKLGDTTSTSTTLAQLGYSGSDGKVSVTSGGKTTDIAVDGTTTVGDFVTKLNSAGVKASYDSVNKRLYVAASDTGVKNDFSLTGSTSDGVNALSALGLNVASDANTMTYTEWSKYAKNTDGSNYFVLDSNGNLTYDEHNIVKTNGTYSESKTADAVQSYLNEVDNAKNNSTTGNVVLKADNESKGTTITDLTKRIKYANAYASVNNTLATLSSDAKKKDIQTLALKSAAELQKSYETDADGNLLYDDDGKLKEATADSAHKVKGSDYLTSLETEAGLITTTTGEDGTPTTDSTKAKDFVAHMKTMNAYEADSDNAANITQIARTYADDGMAGITSYTDGLTTQISGLQDQIALNNTQIAANDAVINKYALISDGENAATLASRISYATGVTDKSITPAYSAGATRVNATDSRIYLNGAEYTSSSNIYNINGLTIEALGETGSNEVSIVTKTDTQGIYDTVKNFLKEYNSLVNEMTSLYNADSSKGYEPLTADEKDGMTDKQIEEWEKKIKDSLLRRDDTLDGVIATMQNSMAKSYTVNGKVYSLSSFGIKTLGVLNAASNEENAYHIDGDKDDTASKKNPDKLMTAINNDPDSVIEFMKQLSNGLYKELDGKMKSTTLSSAYTIYNDKQMSKEYSDYTTTIKNWQDKVKDMEDSYYKKFAAMESALATLQSNASSLSSILG